jgi:hypothetical protein
LDQILEGSICQSVNRIFAMKFSPIKSKLNWLLLSMVMFFTLLLWACGGKSPSVDSTSDKGELSFNIVFYNDTGDNLRSNAASFNCESQGIATVEAKVFDRNDAFVAGGGPWDCEIGHGTISAVPTGSGLTVVILAKDADDNILFRGQSSGVLVITGDNNNIGTISCRTFVPELLGPTDKETVGDGAVALQWEEVVGAAQYHVLISQSSDLSHPVLNDQVTTGNYTLSGLSSDTTYYWQVNVVDPYGNTGTGSQILSFAISSNNTSPVAQISAPSEGNTCIVGETCEFVGSGSDGEDSVVTGASLVWTSNVVGQIGTGETCSWSPLGTHAGTHTITLTAIDSAEAIGTDAVVITIANGRLPDTGQVELSNYNPVPGEDMTYTINPPSYTKIDSGGNDLDADADNWTMVRDNFTGLIWEVKTADNKENVYNTYTNTQEQFIDPLNAADFG